MSDNKLMLDLASGTGSASHPMKDRGWHIITVDINSEFEPDIIADLRDWSWNGKRPDLIWASPPCDEFAREFMPWSKTGEKPDLSIVMACKRIIEECQPRFWVIENVKGAIKWFEPIFGQYRINFGPFFLWGFFPFFEKFHFDYKKKESYSSSAKIERARIPYELGHHLAVAIEKQKVLL